MAVLRHLEADMVVGGVAACEVVIHVIGAGPLDPLDRGQLHVGVGKVIDGVGEGVTVVQKVAVLHQLVSIGEVDARVGGVAVVGKAGIAMCVWPVARVVARHGPRP